ncbi:50S ribosome-binding GTPase [Sediminihabitans luteus]|uniref:50S ribosome-binding GTPase n=1 Tax=Sediminihabitans luteus TaxID=1138585 RepID=A0A2M9CYD2_9CELL|nr:GTPase [Sediminihabitans luteus]PJJ76853.1 50S ribosome-binding GTPase [Sediminihabitans luteus]GIJ00332.1 hypothetical protein Slu03_27090 [Sediminihabitans luteus]
MTDDSDLRGRTDDLEKALDLAGARLDPEVAARVRQAIAGVRERLALGVDHTVVALAGGTGSGKSSLFNRLSRLEFADVGVKRPTTAQITACAWSPHAGPLLDWLEVIPERRIARGDELDAADEAALSGLVLLDLPDHDSIQAAHRQVVDRVLPYVDLLVWVLDPQKYADDSLHTDYLAKSVGYEASMVVAINQIDTVAESQRPRIVADLERLLAQDGLTGVYVASVSAVTAEGVPGLLELLEQAVARRSVAASRVAGELDTAGALLLGQTPAEAPWNEQSAVDDEVEALVQATGLESVAAQVADAVRNGYGRPEFGYPQRDAVGLSRSRWLARAGKGLRPGWRDALGAEVASTTDVGDRLAQGLGRVPLDTSGPAAGPVLRGLGTAFVVLGVLAGIFAGLCWAGVVEVSDAVRDATSIGAAVALVLGVVLWLVAARVRRTLARRRRRGVVETGREIVAAVVEESFAAPTRSVLGEYRSVRELASKARESERVAPLTGAIRLPTAAELDELSTEPATTQDTGTGQRGA